MYLPGRVGAGAGDGEYGAPLIRSISTSYDDRARIGDDVTMEYGFTMDSVSFLDRMNNFSPYARATYSMKDGGQLRLAYTSGNARPDPDAESPADAGLERGLDTLGAFPRILSAAGGPRFNAARNTSWIIRAGLVHGSSRRRHIPSR